MERYRLIKTDVCWELWDGLKFIESYDLNEYHEAMRDYNNLRFN